MKGLQLTWRGPEDAGGVNKLDIEAASVHWGLIVTSECLWPWWWWPMFIKRDVWTTPIDALSNCSAELDIFPPKLDFMPIFGDDDIVVFPPKLDKDDIVVVVGKFLEFLLLEFDVTTGHCLDSAMTSDTGS